VLPVLPGLDAFVDVGARDHVGTQDDQAKKRLRDLITAGLEHTAYEIAAAYAKNGSDAAVGEWQKIVGRMVAAVILCPGDIHRHLQTAARRRQQHRFRSRRSRSGSGLTR